MKRSFVALLLAAALLAPAFGQELNTIDIGQGWINPLNASNKLLPESMLAWISNGFLMDEIDTMARAPLLFGGYKGYSVFTGYGNYESWNGAGGSTVKPFVPGNINPLLNAYQLGLAMPVPGFDGWRAGFLFGQNSTVTGDLEDTSAAPALADQTYLYGTSTQTFDSTPADNVVDYTTLTKYEATDKTTTDKTRVIAALNLGFMGASVYASVDGKSRVLGGAYEFTRTEGTTTDTAIRTSAESTYWGQSAIGKDLAGTEASGKPTAFPDSQSMSFGAIGQLAILGMPLTASLNFRTVANGSNYETLVARRVSRTQTYAQDASAAKINTYEVLSGVGLPDGADWDPTAMAGLPGATTTAAYSAMTPAIDLAASGKLAVYSGLAAALDPTFKLAEGVALKPRAALSYSLGLSSATTSTVAYGSYSLAQAGATVPTEWSYSSRGTATSNGSVHDLQSQLGTALSFESTDANLELVTGVYVLPFFKADITTPTGGTASYERSYKNAAGTPLPGPVTGMSAAAAAAMIGAADMMTGTSSYSATMTTDGFTSTTDLGFKLSVPVAVRLSFFEKKLSLVGGLNASYDSTLTTKVSKLTSTTTSETVTLTDGTNPVAFTAPTASAAHTYPTETWSQSYAVTPWAGSVGFMVRWVPSDNITVDVTGTSVKAAIATLNNMFSWNTGINVGSLTNFIDALSMSVTFHF